MKLKLFLISFAISLPLWVGANFASVFAEKFFFLQEIVRNPDLVMAQAGDAITSDVPVKKEGTGELQVSADSALSIFIGPNSRKNLFAKDPQAKHPIASLTKLMTAVVAMENYQPTDYVEISKKAVDTEDVSGNFKKGEKFYVKDLLYPLLIESSNDAAYALAEKMSVLGFVELMNREAKNIGMANTFFINPTGLDPNDKNSAYNYSTASDLTKLAEYIFKNQYEIKYVSGLPQYDFYTLSGVFHHKIISTNDLLKDESLPWKNQIVSAKTGTTPMAKGCLVLVIKAPQNKGFIINVILGSDNRFEDAKKIVNWALDSYRW